MQESQAKRIKLCLALFISEYYLPNNYSAEIPLPHLKAPQPNHDLYTKSGNPSPAQHNAAPFLV
jgi:hypothetical protein